MSSKVTDESLLRQFVAGRREALGELASRHEPDLLGLARGMLGGREDLACDAVQETWVRVIRHAGAFRSAASVRTWLYRIMINQCQNARQRAARRGAMHLATDEEVASSEAAEAASASDNGRMISQAELQQALSRLGQAKRDLLLLCYHAELTGDQAAEILNIPIGTLKSRLHAARQALREQLVREAES